MEHEKLFEKIMSGYRNYKSRSAMMRGLRITAHTLALVDKTYPELAKVYAWFIDEQTKERERNAEKYSHNSVNPTPSPVGGYEAFCYAVANGCPKELIMRKCKISEADYVWLKTRAEILDFFRDVKKERVKDWNRWNPKNHLPSA